MRFESMRALAATAAVLAGICASSALAAKPQGEPGDTSIITPVFTPLGVDTRPVDVVVKLAGPSVAEQEGSAGRRFTRSEKDSAKEALKGQQDALGGSIAALGGSVVATYQSAYDGIKVRIARNQLAQLAALPGVVAVKPLLLMKPSNVRSIPFIGAPTVWQNLGLRGEGIKVAIIDTGIDYTHANFGGPGTIAAYDAALATDTLPPDPALIGPDAPRVKGGIDLVGDDYDAGDPQHSTPHPDPNPLDCNGHGSHVAGTAAGSGVKADGTTYGGPYDGTTSFAPADWTIGPGVAPRADLYSVRVFGCSGSTNETVDAIDWAVDHDMDVINMSLGSPFGLSDDPSAEASTNAAKAGIVVVTAAGNEGPNPYMVGSPSTGDGAISVAANDPTQSFPGAHISIPGSTLTAIDANGFALPPSSVYTVKYTGNLGCSVADFGGPLAPGTIAVVNRGTCARVAKAIFGQQAGAAAVAMINTDGTFPPFEGPITSNPDDHVPFTVTIPFLGVRGPVGNATSDGGKLAAANGTLATVTPTTLANPTFEALASFSSGGPRNGDSALKPEITAPGVNIFSTAVGTGNGGQFDSGTSMATPHVTGVAALTVEAHPSWKVEDIKSAIVATGAPSKVANYAVSLAGTGEVQPASSTATQVVAHVNGDKFGAALSFGFDELTSDFSGTQTISLANNGASAATFNVAQARASGSPHTLTIGNSTITVPAHASATVNVKLQVAAATAGNSDAFRDVSGLVEFTPVSASDNGGIALRVPYYMVPRVRSNVSTSIGRLTGANPSTLATVTNRKGTIAGGADFYALGLQDGQDNNGHKQNVTNDVRAVGTQSFPFPSGSNPTRKLIVFAVNTWNRWSNASTNEFDIGVDVDGDGVDDYIVVGVDFGAVETGDFNGQMGAFVFSTRSPGASIAFFATAPTDGSVAELPVLSTQLCRAGEPCLSVANPRFSYHAAGFDLVNGGTDVVSGVGLFNPWTNAVSTGGFAAVAPNGSDTSNTISVDSAELALTPPLGLMVVTLDNPSGAQQAQLIPLVVK
ncbi:MAG TPA: S8 family serine peptidase [Usitatibacter sp.]|nr:S8 family serine peptidase [Usitatibacter sp.]